MQRTYEVEMLAFGDGQIRKVTIPEDEPAYDAFNTTTEDVLDLVFKWGQNDFQPQRMPSVSVGDVIRIPDGYGGWDAYRVEPIGFQKL
jgi:hypothetical protein